MWGLAAVAATVFVGVVPAFGASPGESAADPAETDREIRREAERRRAEGDRPFTGTLRTGLEYDTNAYRTAGDDAVDDVLTRYFAVLEGDLPAPDRASMNLQLRQGGKLFAQEHGSDALLTQVRLRYRHRLGDAAYGILDAGMKDRLERRSGTDEVPHQDYNRGGIDAGVGLAAGPVEGFLTGGWRYFAFRPNPSSSNHGPQGTVGLSLRLHRDLRARAQYIFSYRNFHAIRFVQREVGDGEFVVQRARSGRLRNDRLHIGRIGGAYRGPVIVEAYYQLLRNVSNSYAQGLTRHGVELRGTVPLPGRLYASGEVQIQRTSYQEEYFLAADLQVDEENRNAVVVSLTRVVGDHWEFEGRYRLFIEEFGAAADYRRQTASMGLGYVF